MKKSTKIIWITAIVSTIILALIEKAAGMGVGLIGLGSGGEMDAKLTFGGFVLETYYPLTSPDNPYHGPTSSLIFEPVMFMIMFLVRLIIIIPCVHVLVPSEESHSHYAENNEEQGSATPGRLSGFLKYFVFLYILIGLVLTGILIYESVGLCEVINHISHSTSKIIKHFIYERNMLIVFIVFDLIFVLHHFITSGLILKRKHSFLLFYKTSYILVFFITIATVVILFLGGVRYLSYSFFKWHTIIYSIDLILFMINHSYMKESYEVFQYMNNDDSYAKLKLFK